MWRGLSCGEIVYENPGHELLGRVVNSLFHVGLSLQAAIDLSGDEPAQPVADALRRLDDTIREIHDHVFGDLYQDRPPLPPPPTVNTSRMLPPLLQEAEFES